MRALCVVLLVPLLLAACGGPDRKTVVVNPPAGATVVLEPDGDTKVIR